MKNGETFLKPICDRHVSDVLCWAQETFGEKFEPSFQQIEVLTGWSILLNAKRKMHWNQVFPDDQVKLTKDEETVKHKIGMSLQSGHGLSKTTTLSIIALHFLQCLDESRILVTAPAGPQLFTVIWPELYKWINANPMTRAFWKWNSKQIYPAHQGVGGEHWIKPRTIDPKATADEQGEALAGLHGRYTLRVIDEASGVPDAVMLPFEGGLTDPVALIVMGFNPTQNIGFAIETQRRYRDRWLCYQLDGEELAASPPSWYNPNVQKDLLETYGRDSNFYRVRVRGLPPLAAPDTLIPWEWVMEAIDQDLETMDYDPILIGIDVAGEGTDRSVACIRKRHTVLGFRERRGLDTMQVGWWAETLLAEMTTTFPESRIILGVDSVGIGKGTYDYLKTVKGYKDVHAVNVARKMSPTDSYFTYRDRNYWWLRQRFEEREISIPNDDSLVGELTAFRWTDENLDGKIKVEAKRLMRNRLPEGKNSPDKADALMITEFLQRTLAKQEVISAHEARYSRWQHKRAMASNWKTV